MSVAEKIAEAMRAHYLSPDNDTRCVCLAWVDGDDWDDHLAEAVLAAIRAMSPAEQAEVIGGSVLHDNILGGIAVGRWGEVRP